MLFRYLDYLNLREHMSQIHIAFIFMYIHSHLSIHNPINYFNFRVNKTKPFPGAYEFK